jgi:hypothetical protein
LDRDLPVDDGESRLFWSSAKEKIVQSIVAVTEGARSIAKAVEHSDDLVGKAFSNPAHNI